MKVAPAVAEVLGVVDDAAGRTEGYGEVLSVAHAPDAPPAAAPAAPVEEEATAPRPAEMERGREMAPLTVQPGAGGARGSIAAGSDGMGFAATAATKAETSYGTSVAEGVEACVPSGRTVR